MMTLPENAYAAGTKAFYEGQTKHKNPYPVTTEYVQDRTDWYMGFFDAETCEAFHNRMDKQ